MVPNKRGPQPHLLLPSITTPPCINFSIFFQKVSYIFLGSHIFRRVILQCKQCFSFRMIVFDVSNVIQKCYTKNIATENMSVTMATSQENSRKFARVNEKYSLAEKRELGELIQKYKEVYDKESKELEGKTKYDYKRKKHVQVKPK